VSELSSFSPCRTLAAGGERFRILAQLSSPQTTRVYDKMQHEDLSARNAMQSSLGCFFKVCGVILAVMILLALVPAWIYGVNSHHDSPDSVWPPRAQSLIPPTATNITLHRDFLDCYVTYTVAEKDLNVFLNERFARDGEVIDSYAERSRSNPNDIGKAIGRLGFVVTGETVSYHYTTSNGAGSAYFHDPTTGLTYQDSAYW
jgi:hypothetical protein